jgi:hypothetical protein
MLKRLPKSLRLELVTLTYYETDKASWKDNVHLALGGVDERVSWKANRPTGLHVPVTRTVSLISFFRS